MWVERGGIIIAVLLAIERFPYCYSAVCKSRCNVSFQMRIPHGFLSFPFYSLSLNQLLKLTSCPFCLNRRNAIRPEAWLIGLWMWNSRQVPVSSAGSSQMIPFLQNKHTTEILSVGKNLQWPVRYLHSKHIHETLKIELLEAEVGMVVLFKRRGRSYEIYSPVLLEFIVLAHISKMQLC